MKFSIPILILAGSTYLVFPSQTMARPLLPGDAIKLCNAHFSAGNNLAAHHWCIVAQKNGNADAKKYIDLLNAGNLPEINLNQENLANLCQAHFDIYDVDGVRDWCTKAADMGDKRAIEALKAMTGPASRQTN